MGLFKKAINILEFSKVLDMIKNFTSCEETNSLVLNLKPCFNLEEVEKMCSQTDEALVIVLRFSPPEFLSLKSPKDAFKTARYGAFMNCSMIYNIGKILKQAGMLKEFYKKYSENLNYLKIYYDSLFVQKDLEKLIFKSLLSYDEVADDASFELKQIRANINKQNLKIKNILDNFLKGDAKKYLQENISTVRQGRHVLAVKSSYIKQIPGIVHDVSSSGSTVFLEPSLVVAADNELKRLHKKEKDEIERILKDLTQKCLVYLDEIEKSYSQILNLDLIFSKAKLAREMDAQKPNIVENGEISLKKAKHPLINPKVVVPIDIEFGGSFKNLIITGPNTGGKTVALKTVGILTLMTMCGILIPASSESKVSIFREILVAIGDEQSISSSLSTFSAHMKNIVFILNVVGPNSLVLIDEIASGTDPEQGGALAVSIVKQICLKKATLATTTHYTELKSFAFKNKYVKNACFEFNLNSLEPTYKILMGVAGQSNAFEISKKIGLDESIIINAKKFMTKKGLYLSDMLTKLEIYRKEYKKRFALQKQKALKLKTLKEELEKEKQNLNKAVKDKIDKAKQQANLIIEQTRTKAREILAELKEIKNKKNKEKVVDLIGRTKSIVKKNIYGLYDEINDEEVEVESKKNEENLEVGDLVLVRDIDKNGRVLKEVDKSKKVLVKIGNIKTRVDINNLELLEKKKKEKPSVKVNKKLMSKKNKNIKTEIDLRGYDSQEAILVLDSFLDQCVLNNLCVVTIIHGKGTGVLKNAVTRHLKSHPSVLTRRFGEFGEGEDGVTIVELK